MLNNANYLHPFNVGCSNVHQNSFPDCGLSRKGFLRKELIDNQKFAPRDIVSVSKSTSIQHWYMHSFKVAWKDKFFTLFGQPAYLDLIEHETLRKEGVYDDPRVHVAVVCASIGCPMLRDDAFTPEKLEAQLEDGMRRFLSDRTRNRYDPRSRKLEISKIFDWYGKDFEKGQKGYASVKATMARYADLLADKPEERAAVKDQRAEVAFLDYDWSLNDAKR